MSHKIAKLVRRHTRQYLAGLPKTQYITSAPRMVMVPNYAAGLNIDGTPKMRPAFITGTIRLVDHCKKRQQRLLTRKLREHERAGRIA